MRLNFHLIYIAAAGLRTWGLFDVRSMFPRQSERQPLFATLTFNHSAALNMRGVPKRIVAIPDKCVKYAGRGPEVSCGWVSRRGV